MALSTSVLRAAWYPACRPRHDFAAAYRALDAWLKHYGYRPGYGTGAANCRAITGGTGYSLHAYFGTDDFTFWNGYRIPLMALAVDINPPRNPYSTRLITDMPRAMVDAICHVRTNTGHQVWHWGGYFSGHKDAMHYEVTCTPGQLSTGILRSTLPGAAPVVTPTNTGDLVYRIITFRGDPSAPGDQADVSALYLCLMAKAENTGKVFPTFCTHLPTQAKVDYWKGQGVKQSSTVIPSVTARATYGAHFIDGPFRNSDISA